MNPGEPAYQNGPENCPPAQTEEPSPCLRHGDNRKWFALVMEVPVSKLGMPGSGPEVPVSEMGMTGDFYVDVINLKMDDLIFRDMIIREEGIFPAYHMNKMYWISVLMDGTVPDGRIKDLLDMSFMATASAKKKAKVRPPKEWIVPANPKYYDIEHAFDHADEIDWKQGAGIKTGDTVFMYVAAPVSAILYQCKVVGTDIPFHYVDRNLSVMALMRIRLEKRYERDLFTFETLKSEYGIFAVRGPRGIPHSLSAALKKTGRKIKMA